MSFDPATIPRVEQISRITEAEKESILQYISNFNDLVLSSPGGQPPPRDPDR